MQMQKSLAVDNNKIVPNMYVLLMVFEMNTLPRNSFISFKFM